jgi:hypothetical protein
MENPSCSECKFWARDNGSAFGSCRKYTPVRHHNSIHGVWPQTTQKDWCGEFSPQKEAA